MSTLRRDRVPGPTRGRPPGTKPAGILTWTAPAAADVAARVAWLLRVNRLYAGDERWVRLGAFAAAFRGGLYAQGASQSKISRWETGAVRAPYLALRRYEQLLELPECLLVAAADTVYRYAAPAASGPPTLDRGDLLAPGAATHRALENLIEQAQSNALMSGGQWDELTGRISATPDLVLVPRRTWALLAERVLAEMIIADGVPWLQRFEALNRLLGHPVGQGAAVAALASAAADRTNEGFVETVCALDASRHPDASRHVLRQLVHPTNERAQYGALLACVRKVKYGHFTGHQLRDLVALVGGLLDDPGSFTDARVIAVELLRRLPADLPGGAGQRLRRAVAGDPTLGQVLSAGRLADRETGRIVIDRLVAGATVSLARDLPRFRDEQLPVLVDEMLYDPVLDVRLYASMLIYATPYRSPMAQALGAELARALAVRDLSLISSILGALRFLGGPAQRPLMERLILAAGLPAEVGSTAAQHLGHIGGASDDRFWAAALARHGEGWRRQRDPTSATTLHGLVYGLGMARNDELLHRVRGDRESPAPVRAAAAWWAGRPALIHNSARL
ncbi:MAG: hypothetical protein ACM30G_17650 [Micromonosporaceae bacterium]